MKDFDKVKELEEVDQNEKDIKEQETLKMTEMFRMTQSAGWAFFVEEINNQIKYYRDICADALSPIDRQKAWEMKETWKTALELINAWTTFDNQENEHTIE